MPVTPTVLVAIRQEADALPRGQRSDFLRQRAADFGVSTPTLYRQMAAVIDTRSRKRKIRSDKGQSSIDDAAVAVVMAYKAQAFKESGRVPSTQTCIDKLVEAGRISLGMLDYQVNRRARETAITVTDTMCRRMRAAYANQLHRLDFSGSSVFAVHDDDHVIVVPEKDRSKNKRKNRGKRVQIAMVVDDYSSLYKARYFIAPGEGASSILPVIIDIWRYHPGDEDWTFWGLPYELVGVDAGTFRNTHLIKLMVERLGLEYLPYMPGNKRAQGRVERSFGTIKKSFESHYSIHQGTIYSLDEVNVRLQEYVADLNHRRHPTATERVTRVQRWREIMLHSEPVREVPDDILATTFIDKEVRVNGDGTISFEGELYQLDAAFVGAARKIRVWQDVKGTVVAENPDTGMTAHPTVFKELVIGRFDSPAARVTDGQRRRDEASDRLIDLPPPGNPSGNVRNLKPRGKAVEFEKPFAEPVTRFLSMDAALAAISQIVGRPLASVDEALEDAARRFVELVEYDIEAVRGFAFELADEMNEPEVLRAVK